MKKFFAIFMVIMLMCSTVTANVALPDAVTKIYNNYTCDYKMTVTFENADVVVALLDEIGALDEMEKYVDTKLLLESLFSEDSEMTVQVNMSDDFKKIEMGFVSESAKNVTVNKNLNMDVKSNMGMWMRVDLTSDEPVYEMIYLHPFLNKYMVIDLFDSMDEYSKGQLIDVLNTIFNKDYMTKIQEYSVELLKKHSEIKLSGGNCIIKIDNDGFTAMLDDLLKYYYDLSYESLEDKMNPDADGGISVTPYEEWPVFSGMKLLGENGITVNYSLAYGNISSMEFNADVEIDFSDLMGDLWAEESEGVLKFDLKYSGKMSKISNTKVEFPVLTEENSFKYVDSYEYYDTEDYEDYEFEYPYYYAGGYTEYLPVENGVIYVPLRDTIVDAYEDTVDIAYNDGVITLASDYFDLIKLSVGSDKFTIGGATYTTDKVLKINNVTYVSENFFEDYFGWELERADYSILDKDYYYLFHTRNY